MTCEQPLSVQGRQAAQKVADNAVPATQKFNEEQLKPGADRAAEGLKTGADRASKGLQDAADKFSEQAGQLMCCLGVQHAFHWHIDTCHSQHMQIAIHMEPCQAVQMHLQRYA